MDYVPGADTAREANEALGHGSWCAFGAKYVAYEKDYGGPDHGDIDRIQQVLDDMKEQKQG